MTGPERGFLLLTSQLGNPERKPLTVAQLRLLASRAELMNKPVQIRDLEHQDLRELGYGQEMAERIVSLLDEEELLDHYLRKAGRQGCIPITRVSEDYPLAVRKRLGLDSPGCLWAKGDLSILEMPRVSLVGSRVLQQENRERIRAMEEGGRVTYWEVLFQANSFMDLLDRLNMVEEIFAADRSRIEQMRIAADIVEANKINLTNEKADLEGVREQLAADQAALEAKRGESDGLLYELEQKAEEFEILMAESEVLQEELMQEIAQMEVKLEDAKYDEYLAKLALQGENPPSDASWVMPVSGRLTSPFGMRKHPVLGIVRMHNGIDMACDTGTPIYATRAGTVTAASYQAGGAGNYVSINHLDGFASIYMHMTHYVVQKDQTVSAGQIIGYVGSTGISTGPHLHFGISYAGTYVNPLAYIY